MALTTQSASIGGATKSVIVGQDGSGNLAAAHVTVDATGAEKGVSGNPLTVSATSLPLPAGAATAALQAAPGTAGTPSAAVLSVQGVASGTPQPVSGTFWQATQPVSVAALPALAAGSANIGSVILAGGTGTDYSANTAAAITAAQATTLLVTVPVTSGRAYVEVQNQSAAAVSLVRDDGAGSNQVLILLAPGAGAGQQGGGWTSNTFKGRVRVYGASGAQVSAYQE